MPEFFYTAVIGYSYKVVEQIIMVYLPNGGDVADPTYGKGVFWKWLNDPCEEERPPIHVFGSDFEPQTAGCVQADMRELPYSNDTFDSVFLDPPWGCMSTTPNKHGLEKSYNLKPLSTIIKLKELYVDGMYEAKRILKPGGLLVVKCQDFVNSNKKHFFSVGIAKHGNNPYEMNFGLVDAVIQVNPRKPIMRHKGRQLHFRSNHSTWWIMRKQK